MKIGFGVEPPPNNHGNTAFDDGKEKEKSNKPKKSKRQLKIPRKQCQM